jgi:hypothetical protein
MLLGFKHIIPLGLDHILFIICLFLLSGSLRIIIWQATAFTVAHSITLGMAISGILPHPSHIVEPVIALSIAFVAAENLISKKFHASRVAVVFAFGLVHGLGFAGALQELGLPPQKFMSCLISFNVGVELGQLNIILLAWYGIGKWHSNKPWYRPYFIYPVSVLICCIAVFWTFERAFFS